MISTPTIARSPPELIAPAGPTPGGTLPLSSIDRTAGGAGLVNLIQVFPPPSFTAGRKDQGAATAVVAMRDGLARALVPYYLVAGRVAPSGLAVDCTGEGVWFVEAAASCTLADVDGLDSCPLLIPGELLLPRPPPDEKLDGLILMVQATRFTCGGFAVGISFSHAVFDGQGAAQFLTAVGELARGLQVPSVTPVWDRDAIPDPPSPPPPQLTEFRLVTQVADISAESIARVKDEFKQAAATSTGEVCSTSDAVTAVVFKCRALALASALPDDAAVRIAIAAGTRHLLRGVLPAVDGYYGNCVYLACVTRASKAVREASLAEVVGAIREAKEAVPASSPAGCAASITTRAAGLQHGDGIRLEPRRLRRARIRVPAQRPCQLPRVAQLCQAAGAPSWGHPGGAPLRRGASCRRGRRGARQVRLDATHACFPSLAMSTF